MSRLSKARKELLTTMMKETIFEAATSVLSEHGIRGTTMNRVAAAANLAKSSLYDYFESKDELLRFIADRIIAPMWQANEEIIHADLPAPEKLRRAVRTIFEHIGKHQRLVELLLQAGEFHDVMESSKQNAFTTAGVHFAAIFEQGIREGQFRRVDAALLARMLLVCIAELCETELTAQRRPPSDADIEAILNMFQYGISS
jgi:TetR/AcrR family transcriptional regulator, cholesterol catabolism regulator